MPQAGGAEAPPCEAVRHAALPGRTPLTVCDAVYRELALRLGLALATADRALIRSAEAEGVAWI
jgi:predicted nucleic acid-binding protein